MFALSVCIRVWAQPIFAFDLSNAMLTLLSQCKFSARDITHFCGTFLFRKMFGGICVQKWWICRTKLQFFLQSVPIGAFLAKLWLVVVQSEVFLAKEKDLDFSKPFCVMTDFQLITLIKQL